jgi:hypothetical protein
VIAVFADALRKLSAEYVLLRMSIKSVLRVVAFPLVYYRPALGDQVGFCCGSGCASSDITTTWVELVSQISVRHSVTIQGDQHVVDLRVVQVTTVTVEFMIELKLEF